MYASVAAFAQKVMMKKSILFLTIFLLGSFSTAVMSYISMATPIGPWIAPTLVLIGLTLFNGLRQKEYDEQLALVTAAGSVGGIVATALGFSLPTLYFLDPALFNSWLDRPFYFCTLIAALVLAAGSFGIWIANFFEYQLIVVERRSFPIGQLVHKMIAAHNQARKALDLMVGFFGTILFSFAQDGLYLFRSFIPKSITLINTVTIGMWRVPSIQFALWPLLWAIGFTTGHVIAIPLLVGAVSKIVLVDPLNQIFFQNLSNMDFVLAFCSGMILASTLFGLVKMPLLFFNTLKKVNVGSISHYAVTRYHLMQAAMLLLFLTIFLQYFHFPLLAQWYIIVFTFICTYQIIMIAGDIGLAPLGRFATFVMVPAMFIFNLDYVQLVLIATFVEIAGGVAADILFGKKLAYLSSIESKKMGYYQYIGLIVSALVVGIVFWLLIYHFKLGSESLFAYKAQSRQLLINAQYFDYKVLLLGFIFGYALRLGAINPMLVLGGLLMPINISLGLVFGGLITYFTDSKEEWFPFWSGVFAANSIWMLAQTLL